MNIKSIINEEIQNFNDDIPKIMGLRDLAKLIYVRKHLDFNVILEILQDEFYKNGDEGVMDYFHRITGGNITNLSKGKYYFRE